LKNKSEHNYKSKKIVQNLESDRRRLIVLNDNFNTFDHVIDTLINICKHTHQQAEQCTYLIHYKGKCSVKEGKMKELNKMKKLISTEGITSIIK